MQCPNCQFENEEGSKFCLECGERLELQCPQCGKTLPHMAKFCNGCGQKLAEVAETEKAVPQTESERKHVTVLFSDMSGYTAMSERLDPEEVKEITSRIFGHIHHKILPGVVMACHIEGIGVPIFPRTEGKTWLPLYCQTGILGTSFFLQVH